VKFNLPPRDGFKGGKKSSLTSSTSSYNPHGNNASTISSNTNAKTFFMPASLGGNLICGINLNNNTSYNNSNISFKQLQNNNEDDSGSNGLFSISTFNAHSKQHKKRRFRSDLLYNIENDDSAFGIHANPSTNYGGTTTCIDVRNKNNSNNDNDNNEQIVRVATGLTSGTVGVHQLSIKSFSSNDDVDETKRKHYLTTPTNNTTGNSSCEITTHAKVRWYSPKHARPATSVSFRPTESARHFVVGLDGFRRDFSCLVWDVEGNNNSTNNNTGASNAVWKSLAEGVSSLNWVDEQTLAIGCQKFLRLFDVRVSGTSNPPLTVLAHDGKVLGTLPKDDLIATFCDKSGEGVKLWDIRKFSDPVMTINPTEANDIFTAVTWSKTRKENITCASGNIVRSYDVSTYSRPTQVHTTYNSTPINYISFQPPNSNDSSLFPERLIVTGVSADVN